MKKLLTLLFLYLFFHCAAQEKVTYFDNNGNKVKEKEASILLQQIKLNDTLWEFNTYSAWGPRLVSLHTKDEQGLIRNGKYSTYHGNGYRDTTGQYVNGKREGNWLVVASNGPIVRYLYYKEGELISEKDTATMRAESAHKLDSLRKAGVLTKENAFTRIDIESEFSGGLSAWRNYLGRNQKYPKRALKKNIEGTVVVAFIIDKEGRVDPANITIDHSVEYSLDAEAWRVIHESPEWRPANQNGHLVKSYKKQPIIFKLAP